jgi:hypothetical protein
MEIDFESIKIDLNTKLTNHFQSQDLSTEQWDGKELVKHIKSSCPPGGPIAYICLILGTIICCPCVCFYYRQKDISEKKAYILRQQKIKEKDEQIQMLRKTKEYKMSYINELIEKK